MDRRFGIPHRQSRVMHEPRMLAVELNEAAPKHSRLSDARALGRFCVAQGRFGGDAYDGRRAVNVYGVPPPPLWVLPELSTNTGGRKACFVSSHSIPKKAHACARTDARLRTHG